MASGPPAVCSVLKKGAVATPNKRRLGEETGEGKPRSREGSADTGAGLRSSRVSPLPSSGTTVVSGKRAAGSEADPAQRSLSLGSKTSVQREKGGKKQGGESLKRPTARQHMHLGGERLDPIHH